ncbi:hypothetical protein NMG60_11023075 [Bertholletia excelsa]
MASPPFRLEDPMDEDFFDKLVDEDDTGFTVSGSVPSENAGTDGTREFSNLSQPNDAKTDFAADGGLRPNRAGESGSAVIPASSDFHEDNLLAEDVVQASDIALESKGELDSENGNHSVSSRTVVKEVDWNSFNSAPLFHNSSGIGSYSDFFSDLDSKTNGADNSGVESNNAVSVPEDMDGDLGSFSSVKHEDQYHGSQMGQPTSGHDLNSTQYWESLYPGWRYDPDSRQWYQVGDYDATMNSQQNFDATTTSAADAMATDQASDTYYSQQTGNAASGKIEECTMATVTNWNQRSEENMEYPYHMVFDPQYPGWYYDTIAQEWRLLESYTAAMNQPSVVHNDQQNQDRNVTKDDSFPKESNRIHDKSNQIEKSESQSLNSLGQVMGWAGSMSDCNQQNRKNKWQAVKPPHSDVISMSELKESDDRYESNYYINSSTDQQNQQRWFKPSGMATSFEQQNQALGTANSFSVSQSFIPPLDSSKLSNQQKRETSQQTLFSPAYVDGQTSPRLPHQPLQSGASGGMSSSGRPPHALVTFGFGGKLVVMKDTGSFINSEYGQDSAGRVINITNLMDVVMYKHDISSTGSKACDYFYTLCQQSFPGPLVGGNVGNKEVNKWIDEKIAKCESPDKDYKRGEFLRLLLSLLKIACQFYGKLRAPFGTDKALKESDRPESAVANLFASAKRNGTEYGAFSHCLQNFPTEGDVQVTAAKVQKHLVTGRTREALQCAQEGQLWGPALVLAAQLGNQFYGDTVKLMALRQLVVGSPLRTLCLLIAGKPADVFSNTTSASNGFSHLIWHGLQNGAVSMLDEWKENLAIVTANRTKDDELVIIHLGDCLWKEKGEVTAAHICYLVAEANFESYSDSARMCLVGADHWRFPRTYATPEAIQRTELYEYSKVLGNPQFILLPFQPYKLIYAYMLAEVGKISDSLKYCQAILKCLKTSRVPEVETWKSLVSSLEERIKLHQQGGYSNLAPAKLVGKLLNLFDSTAHRVVGGLPATVPSASHSHNGIKGVPGMSNSQSTMAMSSLMPSESKEPISEWRNGRNRPKHNRSISEPDIGKTPIKVDSSNEGGSPDKQETESGTGGSSRFGRIGSQLFQKTFGRVMWSRSDRQAKLGERNKFYYDEKLKRWVEEGSEPPAEEATLAPPPTTAALPNRIPDYTSKGGPKNDKSHFDDGPEHSSPPSSERNSGIPPIPPSSNQFSARGRMGVRSRYVDTFNKGGMNRTNFPQSPSLPGAKPARGSNPKFFIPTLVASGDETVQTLGENLQESVVKNESPSKSVQNKSFSSPPSRHERSPSMDNIAGRRTVSRQSRRHASWSGIPFDPSDPSHMAEIPEETTAMPSSLYTSRNLSRASLGKDLHEVEF